MRKIDIFNHVVPSAVADLLRNLGPAEAGLAKRLAAIPLLHDMDARVRMMERWPGYEQVITLGIPIEAIASESDSPAVARLANNELLAIHNGRPDKFSAWVASLPMNNVDGSLEEMDRAIHLGASGIQVFTNVTGAPLDEPRFFPIFDRATNYHRVPIWMHPARNASSADYKTESVSKYEIWQVLGWPYETSVAMARFVFSGMLDALPELRLITHHLGAMIPYFEGRVGPLWDQLGTRTPGAEGDAYTELLRSMKAKGRRPIDYFKAFYNDTSVGGSQSAIRCGLDFFGHEHVLFGTDCPLDPEGGPMFIRETIAAIDRLQLSDVEQDAIYWQNALKMLRLGEGLPT